MVGVDAMNSEVSSVEDQLRGLLERERSLRSRLFPLEVSDALRRLADPDDVLGTACRLLGEHLDVDRCFFADLHHNCSATIVSLDYCRTGLTHLSGTSLPADLVEQLTTLKESRRLVIYLDEHAPGVSELSRSCLVDLGISTSIWVPLVKEGRLRCTLAIISSSARRWTDDEAALVEDVAERAWDALDRARSIADLRVSEAKYRSLFESIDLAERDLAFQSNLLSNVREAVIAFDQNFAITYWNERAERVFGWSVMEVIGRTTEDLFRPRFTKASRNDVIGQLLATNVWEGEQYVRYKNGQERIVEAHVNALRTPTGEFLGGVGTYRDVTERKEAERKLAFQADLLANINDPMTATDENLEFTYWNKAAERLFGWTAEEIIGCPSEIVFDSVFPGSSREAALSTLLSEDHWEGEVICHRKDGTPVVVEIHSTVLRGPNGEVRGTVTSRHDITQRKRLLAQVEDARRRFQTVVDYVPDGITVWRAPDFRCELVNPVYRNFAPEKSFLGSTIVEAWPELADRLIPQWRSILASGEPYSGKDVRLLVRRKPDGPLEEHFFNLIHVPLPPDDSGHPAIASFAAKTTEDVWARQRMEALAADAQRQALEASVANETLEKTNAELTAAVRRAEDARAALDEFLSVAAHEMKTPVTSIRGFAQTVLDQYQSRGTIEPERLGRALQVIDQQAGKLSRLVSQLLDTSRMQAGKLALEQQWVDLVPLVEEVAATARLNTPRHALTLEIPQQVVAFIDVLRVEQVLRNLLDNAIRYSPNGGLIELTVAVGDDDLTITVRDHGIGIPSEHLSRVFDRFHRAHQGGNVAGLGLGLYISRDIVQRHGGRIEVESPADGGTRFVVQLPLVRGGSDEDREAEVK
jgi:PAS domain S-box-containing protein